MLRRLPVFALAALSMTTAAQVACTETADDSTEKEPAGVAEDAGGLTWPADAGCRPARVVVEMQAERGASCIEFCKTQGLKCNEKGYATVKNFPFSPYEEDPATCRFAGMRVSYFCPTCYSGSDFASCAGTPQWSTVNNKSGPYAGTYCACSPL